MSYYRSYGSQRKVDWEQPRGDQRWRTREEQVKDQRDLIIDLVRSEARTFAKSLSRTDYLSHGEFVMLLKLEDGRFLSMKFPQNSIREQSFIMMLQNPALVHLNREGTSLSRCPDDYNEIQRLLEGGKFICFQPGFPRYGEDAEVIREWSTHTPVPAPAAPKGKSKWVK